MHLPIIILVALAVTGGGISYLRNLDTTFVPEKITPIPTPKHPYAISSLMSRVSPDGKIIVESENPSPSRFKSYTISYLSENLKQYALMLIPSGSAPASGWPVIIVNHGYIPPQQYSTVNSYKNTSAFYASSGFLVLKPDYRGHNESEGTIDQYVSRNQYAVDVLNLIAALKSIPQADPSQIFIYGHSLGGDVALQIAEVSNQIAGISLWAPAVTSYPESLIYFRQRHSPSPTDGSFNREALDRLLSVYPAQQFSSLDNINLVTTPVIIHHGTSDQSVPYAWGQYLTTALKAQNKTVILYSYPNDNHDIVGHWSEALSRDLVFFNSLFKSQKNTSL